VMVIEAGAVIAHRPLRRGVIPVTRWLVEQ
jgi:hypothetical protein